MRSLVGLPKMHMAGDNLVPWSGVFLNTQKPYHPYGYIGDRVRIQNQTGHHPNKWDRIDVVVEVHQYQSRWMKYP